VVQIVSWIAFTATASLERERDILLSTHSARVITWLSLTRLQDTA